MPGTTGVEAVRRLDGLLLSGGPDIDPSWYGKRRSPWCGPADAQRDALEFAVAAEALRLGLPMLGICRGMQVLNIVAGGTLNQHVDHPEWHHHRYRHEAVEAAHPIELHPQSRLQQMVGASVVIVNSRHHQAIEGLGRYLRIGAVAPDGVIEAIEHVTRPNLIGVQWHPEDRIRSSRLDRSIFDWFVQTAESYAVRETRTPTTKGLRV